MEKSFDFLDRGKKRGQHILGTSIQKDTNRLKKFSKNLQPRYTKIYNNEGEQILLFFVILTNILSIW